MQKFKLTTGKRAVGVGGKEYAADATGHVVVDDEHAEALREAGLVTDPEQVFHSYDPEKVHGSLDETDPPLTPKEQKAADKAEAKEEKAAALDAAKASAEAAKE